MNASNRENGSRGSGSSSRRPGRLACVFCSISAVFFCLGVIIGVAGLVVYILVCTSNTSSVYLNDLLYFRTYPLDKHQPAILAAIVLGSIGLGFIVFASILAIIACFTSDNNCTRKRSSRDYKNTADTGKSGGEPLTAPLIESENSRISVESITPKQLLQEQEPPVAPHGDMNTVGLPSRQRVPPNGFRLVHPSEIHSYHENRHAPVRPQAAPRQNPPEATRSMTTAWKRESAI